ncbi:DUF2924 domain-containing protein [Alteraurantiacibacter buctensis]|uniref:DUF2924 domain-containing protein n=1 Tax=Alteraurantiacibacter buctensis TaxID=1503981 RepID=A0A844YT66_9SPHN|nr:DUF2924 domain-containing protein [Alteraurantiacibacter buctensis]MXO70292.1 DUF2924 domain-containing protein [Alteraurantiacibacter buctensis]
MTERSYITLERLAAMPLGELKAEWTRRYDAPAPNLSSELLRLGLGYKMQEQRLGGVNRSTRTLLRQVVTQGERGGPGRPLPRKLTPGTRLVRDWHGVGHTVVVLEDGFEFDGKHWKSLTAIAKAITGNHWNGPLFFGLTKRGKKP